MNDSPSTGTTAEFAGKAWALRLCAALVLGLAVIVVLTMVDRERRATLEEASDESAAADRVYFHPPKDEAKPRAAAARLNGRPLFPISYKTYRLDDADARRVGRDDATGLTIYEAGPGAPKSDDDRAGRSEPFYLLKTGPQEYVKVR
jgi:hypothetical protein